MVSDQMPSWGQTTTTRDGAGRGVHTALGVVLHGPVAVGVAVAGLGVGGVGIGAGDGGGGVGLGAGEVAVGRAV